MGNSAIDWNVLWKAHRSSKNVPKRDVNFWDKKAEGFSGNGWSSNYANDFVRIMEPKRCWTVFDMACGTGALAVPLARYVRRVTAADYSPKMLEVLDGQCRTRGLDNVTMINLSWEDDWKAKGIDKFDVAVASRCLVVDDLKQAITKLDGVARERVYISTIVGDGPHDRRIYKAAGKELRPGPDYICTYNILHQMGIYANLKFIRDHRQESFDDLNAAFTYHAGFIGNVSARGKKGLREYLARHLVPKNGRLVFDYKKLILWAVMWWEKE